MTRNCLVYHPVLETPLSDPNFAQDFTGPNSNVIPTRSEEYHLTILGAREYPDTPLSSRLCICLPKRSKEGLKLSVAGARILGGRALVLVLNDPGLLQEERWRIDGAFIRAGAVLSRHGKLKPHITIANISSGVSQRQVVRRTESMLPTDPTVIIGGITQNSLSGKTFDEEPIIKFIFSDKGCSTPRTADHTTPPPRRGQRKRGRSRRHSHR